MSERAKHSRMKTAGQEIWIACTGCRRRTCHEILTGVEVHDEDPLGEVQTWTRYMTVACKGCQEVSFCEEATCSEDMEIDPDGATRLIPTLKIYPSRLVGRGKIADAHLLPHGVYRVYEEAYAALCNQHHVLAGLAIRVLIEAVCRERATKGKTLKSRIDALVTLGVATREGASILHSLRFLGNKAAHEARAHRTEELSAAFDVVEHLLTGVYVLPRRAKKLPGKGA
ncbi:MAG: DUF4145 domain-containing protein [Candidatus Eisenbacteria sp.]|nr:DUF4145 domain-containing protein [Candidatus Eisenbacteria bacterium]